MSSIVIQDLAHHAAMDSRAMLAVRGGSPIAPNVSVNVNLNQQFGQFQQIGVSVLNNNGVIGAGSLGPEVSAAAALWYENRAAL